LHGVAVFCKPRSQDDGTVDLADFAVNLDGVVTVKGDPFPVTVDAHSFDLQIGLGTVFITVSGLGSHGVSVFVDHEIDQLVNGFTNEFGDPQGTLAAGQSWEIDEPGFNPLPPFPGNIFTNFTAGALDNTTSIPPSSDPTSDGLPGDDVAMALSWQFTLALGERAVVGFQVALTAPGGGFFLVQTDSDSTAALFFSSSLDIQPDAQPIPEPATGVLWGSGLVVLVAWRRKRHKRT
jgi:hypothetical protein